MKSDYDYDNPFYNLAKYKFLYDEPDDFGDAFDYAYNILSLNKPNYEKMNNMNALFGKLQYPTQSTENITYYGLYDNIDDIDINKFNDDEIVIVVDPRVPMPNFITDLF